MQRFHRFADSRHQEMSTGFWRQLEQRLPPVGPMRASRGRTFPSARAGTGRRRAAPAPSAHSRARGGCRPTPDGTRPTSSITRSNGPSRSRTTSILGRETGVAAEEHRVSFGVRITIDDHSVALRSFMPRPEKCCDGAAVTERLGVRQSMRFPPVEFDDALGPHAPRLEMRADAERRHERYVALRQFANRRIVEMVVVIVRHDHDVDRRQRAKRHRHRLEPLRSGETGGRGARSPDRIGEHAQAVDLDQHRRMTEPRRAQARYRLACATPRAGSSRAAARAARAARRRRESR